MNNWKWETREGITFITLPHWLPRGVDVAFSTRLGGVSQIPYQSLNLGLHVGDDREAVLNNRYRFLRVWTSDLPAMVCCQQVHSNQVVRVDNDNRGSGAFSVDTSIKGYDGMVTSTAGLYLSTFYADCLPVFFFDSVNRAIGMAHSGWKGTRGMIVVETLLAMQREFGSLPGDMEVFIGPGIGRCCFEISSDLAAKVKTEFGDFNDIIFRKDNDIYTWDLPSTNRQLLIKNGVRPDNIVVCDLCTACNVDKFYSYRREQGNTGRMGALLGLRF